MKMMITERQSLILEKIISDYIDSAEPIGSEFLNKKHNFGISPATIRIEMQKLTDKGYLSQPHTSAGRIPTDKGYRFFVDQLFETKKEKKTKKYCSSIGSHPLREGFSKELNKRIGNIIKNLYEKEKFLRFSQEITEILASISSNLASSYLFDEKIFWKQGWLEILEEPEFRKVDYLKSFMEMVEEFEKSIEDFTLWGKWVFKNSKTKVFIGRENPFSKVKDFSIIISRCYFPNKQKGILAILGPKRMAYQKNIDLINSLTKLLKEY